MFVTDNASVFTFFAEVCYSGDPFAMLIRERRGAVVKEVSHEQGHTAPYAGYLDGR
jgi:hypothetical protein